MATRAITPRSDNEGSIGTALKKWMSGFFATITTANLQATGGNISGITIVENFTTSTNPTSSAAVTTAIIDAYNGIVITLSTTGNAQTIATPTAAAVKRFTVINNDTSTNTITVNGITIGIGKSQSFIYDGTAWNPFDLGITALPVPINQGGTGQVSIAAKNPPIDADKAIYRDSTASDSLVTSTWTQIKAFLKTYFDTLYDAAGTAAGKIASSISDGDTTHAPDGNSVFDALALKAPVTNAALVTPTRTTAPADNDSTLALASTAFAKSQDAVLAREPDQSVALTAAAIAAIKTTHDAKFSNTTNNFGLGGMFILPTWTPAANQTLRNKWAANVGYKLEVVLTSGAFVLYLNDTVYTSVAPGGGAASNLVAGTKHSILAVPTVGATTTTVSFFLDGVLLSTTAAQNNEDVTTTGDMYTGGTSAATFAMTVFDTYDVNFAPTAAEVLDMYRNGLPESWKWGSQTELLTGTGWANNGGDWSYETLTVNANGKDIDSAINSSSNAECDITTAKTVTIGKKYKVSINLARTSGQYPNFFISDSISSHYDLPSTALIDGVNNFEIVATTATWKFGFTNTAVSQWAVTVSFYEIGATLALTPESWQSDKPYDCSSNNLVCAYPATGWSLTRPILLAHSISDGDTTHAPDGNSVFDALALKQAKSGDGLAITAGKTITCTENTSLDEAVAMSSKAPKTQEAWHLVGTGIEPAFENNWVNYGSGGHATAGFYKDTLGVVHLKGLVKNTTDPATVIFTLPAGYIPPETMMFVTTVGGTFIEVAINTSGHITGGGTGSAAYMSMAGFSFRP